LSSASRFNRRLPYPLHRRVWLLLLLASESADAASAGLHLDRHDGAHLSGPLLLLRVRFFIALTALLFGCRTSVQTAREPRAIPPILGCGMALPQRCLPQGGTISSRSYSTLPSQEPCPSCTADEEGGYVQSLQAKEALKPTLTIEPQTIQLLSRAAKGEFGDSLRSRQLLEGALMQALYGSGELDAADDLAFLILTQNDHFRQRDASWAVEHYLPRCPTLRTLTVLMPTYEPFCPECSSRDRSVLALKATLKARGLVELGEYEEARSLLKEFGPQVTDPPAFIAQCVEWLEGRPNQRTAVPVGRPCNCDIEPPQWREGCGCEPRQPFVAPEASEPEPAPEASEPEPEPLPPPGECLCDPSGLRCERRVARVDLDDAKAFIWTSERCVRKAAP
jgi:hypothetical protein